MMDSEATRPFVDFALFEAGVEGDSPVCAGAAARGVQARLSAGQIRVRLSSLGVEDAFGPALSAYEQACERAGIVPERGLHKLGKALQHPVWVRERMNLAGLIERCGRDCLREQEVLVLRNRGVLLVPIKVVARLVPVPETQVGMVYKRAHAKLLKKNPDTTQ